MTSMFVKYCGIHLFIGLSTDEKPIVAPNASRFYEMDTKKEFYFDKENSVWVGSSPTPTGDEFMFVHLYADQMDQTVYYTADKTPEEIVTAIQDGKMVYCVTEVAPNESVIAPLIDYVVTDDLINLIFQVKFHVVSEGSINLEVLINIHESNNLWEMETIMIQAE